MDFKSQTPNSEFLTEDKKSFLGTARYGKVQGI